MGRKSRTRTRTFYRERAEESKSIRYVTRSVVQALEKGQDPAQQTPEVPKQARRTARHAVKALDHPLYKRLKEDVDNGKVDLRRYGYVPKNPKPAWWVQKARKIYEREAKTEIDMDVKAFGVDEENEHGPKEEKDPDIEIAQVFRAKEEYAMDIDGGDEIRAMKMEQSLSSAPSSLRNHTVPEALSPSNDRPSGLVNPWDVHGFQTSETNSSPQPSDGRRAQRDSSPFIRPELDELSWEEQSEELMGRGRSGWPPSRMHLSKAPGWKEDNTNRNAQMMGKVGEALQRGGGLEASDGSLLGVKGACRAEETSRPFGRIMNARLEQNTQTHVQNVKEENQFGYIKKDAFNIENAKRVNTKKENVTTDDGPTEEQEWRVCRKEGRRN